MTAPISSEEMKISTLIKKMESQGKNVELALQSVLTKSKAPINTSKDYLQYIQDVRSIFNISLADLRNLVAPKKSIKVFSENTGKMTTIEFNQIKDKIANIARAALEELEPA